ncbi:MAG: YfhO family protein, partial [Clostridiales bacterium]|nr:YfhO family protein [Clostridiales bacterium]
IVFGLASVAAAFLAAFALIPTYFVLKNCSATSDNWPADIKFYFSIFDFLANNLAAIEPTIRSSGEDVLPNVYCGILTLVLVPLYLLTKSISVKEKTLSVLMLGIFYFSFNINYVNFVWHGLHFPNDLPYRFSFIYSFFILTLAFKAFVRIKELSGKEVFLSGLGVVGFIVLVQEIGSKNVDDATVLTSLAFAVVYTLILILFRNKKFQYSAMALLLLCCVISESAIANTDHYSMSQKKADYCGDYDDFTAIKSDLDAYDGGFYRMELTDLRTRMDPAWYNYNGVSVFSSMALERLANLQSHLGVYGNYINSYTYYPQTPVYNAMMSLKYLMKKTSDEDLENADIYKRIFANDTFEAYKNEYPLSIAYCVGSALEDWEHEDSNPFDVQSDYFKKATGITDDVFTEIPITDVDYNNIEEFYSGFETGDFSFYKTDSNSSGSVSVTLTPMKTENCYLYVKSRSVDSINVSGDFFDKSQNIDEAYILDLGVCEKGSTIAVDIPFKDDDSSGSLVIHACGINMDTFRRGYNILKAGQLNVTSFKDTLIEGTFTAKKSGLLYTSIPYDEGWSVKIDGKTVGKENYVRIGDSLIGIKVTAGTHTLTMKYMPKGFLPGSALSVVTLTALIAIYVISKRRKEDSAETVPEVAPDGEIDGIPDGNENGENGDTVSDGYDDEDGFALNVDDSDDGTDFSDGDVSFGAEETAEAETENEMIEAENGDAEAENAETKCEKTVDIPSENGEVESENEK